VAGLAKGFSICFTSAGFS